MPTRSGTVKVDKDSKGHTDTREGPGGEPVSGQ